MSGDPRVLVQLSHVAKATGLDPGTLRCWARAGKLDGALRTPGGSWLVDARSFSRQWAAGLHCAADERATFEEATFQALTGRMRRAPR